MGSTYKLNNGPSLNYNISASSDKEPESTMIDSSESDSDEDNELESEFLETKKYKFPSLGSDTTPAHQMSDFKFKDYCPQIFRQLREWFRISTQEYLVTICGDFKLLEFISNSKSGQFFFFFAQFSIYYQDNDENGIYIFAKNSSLLLSICITTT